MIGHTQSSTQCFVPRSASPSSLWQTGCRWCRGAESTERTELLSPASSGDSSPERGRVLQTGRLYRLCFKPHFPWSPLAPSALLMYLTLQLRHLQSVLYLRRVGELRVKRDGGFSLPVFFVLFLRQTRSDQDPSAHQLKTNEQTHLRTERVMRVHMCFSPEC